MSGLIASGNSTTTLIDRKSWPRWYLTLKLTAQCLRIWHMIDPDEPSDDEEIPERPTAEKARERLVKKARIKSAKAAGAGNPESQNLEYLRLSTESPSSLEPTESQIAEELILMRHHYVIDRRIFNSENLVRQNIKSWIESTVDRELYLTALFKLQNRNKGGVKEIIRVLREMTAPSGTNTESVLAAHKKKEKKREGGEKQEEMSNWRWELQ
ncbi:hypothetical protein VTI28DRAFT_5519 [Corynascus sepedonium]